MLPRLCDRSGVAGDDYYQFVDSRVSQSGWLPDSRDPVVAATSLRMHQITNLSMETAEQLQIANYGVGGLYNQHYDFLTDPSKHPKEFFQLYHRVATVLMYLSDVELGGTTAFIKAGVNVKPEKGGAVFWYNLRRDGSGDMDTLHAACPVLVGVKWVANKWIKYAGQEFVYPCLA